MRYVGDLYEVTNAGVVSKDYSMADQRIAVRNAGTLTYIHSDNLGSTSVLTNSKGSFAGRVQYWPFGRTRSTSGVVTATDKKFTGHPQELNGDALELYHYGARVYSTLLGRFTSVDPVAGGGLKR